MTTPAGKEMTIIARRKIDMESVDPLEVPVPVFIQAAWTLLRERRNHLEYQHTWVVSVVPRYGFEKPKVIAEISKHEALDLVDAYATGLANGAN